MPIHLRRVDHDPWANVSPVNRFQNPDQRVLPPPPPPPGEPVPWELRTILGGSPGRKLNSQIDPGMEIHPGAGYSRDRPDITGRSDLQYYNDHRIAFALPITPESLYRPIVFGGEQAAKRTGGPSNVPVARAREMAGQGKDADTIFQATGWYRAPDGSWKYIISDKDATLNKNAFVGTAENLNLKPSEKPVMLPQVLNHPELYKAYPTLRSAIVQPLSDADKAKGILAGYNDRTNVVFLGDGSEKEMVSNLLHELQHGGPQREEDFGKGGTSEQFHAKDLYVRAAPVFQEYIEARDQLKKAGGKPYALEEHIKTLLKGGKLNQYEQAFFDEQAKKAPPELFNRFVEAAQAVRPIKDEMNKADEDYSNLAGEVESRQVQKQYETGNWNQRPTAMPGFPKAEDQIVSRRGEGFTPGVAYNWKPPEIQALPAKPFDPWDSGRSLAPTDIAPLTDVSQGIRDYARDVVTGEVARRGLEYYNQNPMEAGLALSGGGLGIKRIGPPEGNIVRVGQPPKTYEAAAGSIRGPEAIEQAIPTPQGYSYGSIYGAGSQVRPLSPETNPQLRMDYVTPGPNYTGNALPPALRKPGDALPEGTQLTPLEPTNTNQPTHPLSGQYRLMPAFTKKDQWSIIDPRGEIMFRSPDKATAQQVFDFVNKGTTGLAVGGLGATGALVGGEAQAAKPSMQFEAPSNFSPQSQAEPQGYELREVDHDPFTPGVQNQGYLRVVGDAQAPYPKDVQDFYDFVRSYPQQARATPVISNQAIPSMPGLDDKWSWGNNAPNATPSRFSDIAPPMNYYQPLSNLNGVPTYGG